MFFMSENKLPASSPVDFLMLPGFAEAKRHLEVTGHPSAWIAEVVDTSNESATFLKGDLMKKKRKKYQTVQPTQEPAPEPEKVIHITAGRVQVGDMVERKLITFSDDIHKDADWMVGRVVWIHPLNRFHVVEFGEGRRAVRESFMGVGVHGT